MSKLFFVVISWMAFAVIYASEVLRIDGLGGAPTAAAWYVYLTNAVGVLLIATSFSPSARAGWWASWRERGALSRLHGFASSIAWMALLSYVGWMWSFGLHAVACFVLYGVRAKDAA